MEGVSLLRRPLQVPTRSHPPRRLRDCAEINRWGRFLHTRGRSREGGVTSPAVPATEPLDPDLIAASAVVGDPRWSPDGTRLAWVRSAGSTAELVVAPEVG